MARFAASELRTPGALGAADGSYVSVSQEHASKANERLTRLFFASDFHGSERIFRKFVNAAKHYEADVLVMGGDVVGKLAIPVIREGNGSFRAHLMGKTERLEGSSDLKGFEDRLGTLGYYSKIMDEDEYQEIRSDPVAVDRLFHELASERLASWIDLAETRLTGSGVKCFVMGGNDDDPEVLELLKDANTQSIVFCEGKEVADRRSSHDDQRRLQQSHAVEDAARDRRR